METFNIEYKSLRNKFNIAMRQAKTNNYRDKISLEKENPKKTWKTINSLLDTSRNSTVVNKLKIKDYNIDAVG